jgi:hypothetical protein
MNHILIVGGTGMLQDVAGYYTAQRYYVTVLARNAERLFLLKKMFIKQPGKIIPIAQDYRDWRTSIEKIKDTIEMIGPVDTAILWIHDTGEIFSDKLKALLFTHHPLTKVYQLQGSASAHPISLTNVEWKYKYPEYYREIYLGYVQNGSSTRWLNNKEIAGGVIEAIENDGTNYTIGELDPWERRP